MKLSELLNVTEKYLYFPHWSEEKRKHILKHLSKTTDLNELYNWTPQDDFGAGIVYSMPYWFLLVKDIDLLSELSKHSLIKITLDDCKKREKETNKSIGVPLWNIMDYPFLFDYNMDALKLLLQLDYQLNNKFISSLLREKQYDFILKIYEENLLIFNEQDILKSDSMYSIYNKGQKQNKTLLDELISNIEEQDDNEKLEVFIFITKLFKLGMQNKCYMNNNLSLELKKIKDSENKELTLEEILTYLPKSLLIYEKIKLNANLSIKLSDTMKNQTKNKI